MPHKRNPVGCRRRAGRRGPRAGAGRDHAVGDGAGARARPGRLARRVGDAARAGRARRRVRCARRRRSSRAWRSTPARMRANLEADARADHGRGGADGARREARPAAGARAGRARRRSARRREGRELGAVLAEDGDGHARRWRRASSNGCSTPPPISAWRARSSTGALAAARDSRGEARCRSSRSRRARASTTSSTGREDAPVLMLSNSLGTDARDVGRRRRAAFADALPRAALRQPRPRPLGRAAGPYTIERLGRDALALLDALGLERVAFCGLSKGGMVGQWLGANAPDRRREAGARQHLGPHRRARGLERADRDRARAGHGGGRAGRDRPLVHASPSARAAPEAVAQVRAMLEATDPEGYVACCAAVRDMDLRDAIAASGRPTLVIAGRHDLATPPEHARLIAERIAGRARCVELDAAHLSNVEAQADVHRGRPRLPGRLRRRWTSASATTQGLAGRRAVLGGAHVDRALARRTRADRRVPGPDHPLRLGRDLDPARASTRARGAA